MTNDQANQVYTLLVNIGGANEDERESFVIYHTDNYGYDEWRFQGYLGFGGKFRNYYNTVDCYMEDENPKRIKIMRELNLAISKIFEKK